MAATFILRSECSRRNWEKSGVRQGTVNKTIALVLVMVLPKFTLALANRWTKVVVWILCLIPAVVLAYRWQTDQLGINIPERVEHFTGDWILRFLLATLLITPLRRIPALNQLIRYRRMFGLYAFFYACLHLASYLWLDKQFYFSEVLDDITKRRFYIFGVVAFTCLLLLALTSTKGWIRRLGRNWQRLHRLIYLAVIVGVIHFALQGKSVTWTPIYWGIAFGFLLLIRVVFAVQRRLQPQPPRRVKPATV